MPSYKKGISRFALMLIFVVLWMTKGAYADTPIVTADDVKAALARGTLIWDVRAAPAYQKGHIPGAVNIGDAGAVLRNPTTEDFIDTTRIEKLLGDAGIDPARDIIVYGERGSPYAYFGRFALRYFGGQRISVYHDGIEGWLAAGQATETAPSRPAAVSLKLVPQPAVVATTEDMITRARDGRAQIIDARTVSEYAGEDVRAIRGGHIPNAVNIPYEKNWQDPDTQAKLAKKLVTDNRGSALAANDQIKSAYAELDPAKETIVYCQSGVRASETATVLESLGFRNVKVYDASWLGYASRLDAPVANETFFNVGAINGKLAALQKRLDQQEERLNQLQQAAPTPSTASTLSAR